MKIDGFSLSYLIHELDAACQGSRIEKIWQTSSCSVVLQLRRPGNTFHLSINASPDGPWLYLGRDPREALETPTAFCMLLRKHLGAARLSSIRQIARDRVVCLTFDYIAADGVIRQKQLYAELIGKYSNLIFVTDDIIVDAVRRVSRSMSQVREILPGLAYQLPPNPHKIDLGSLGYADLLPLIPREPDMTATTALIKTFDGLGKIAAQEILYRASVPADAAVEFLTVQQLNRLRDSLAAFPSGFAAAPQATVTQDRHGKILSITHYPRLQLPPAGSSQQFADFSAAVIYACSRSHNPIDQQRQQLLQHILPLIGKARRKLNLLAKDKKEALDAEKYRIYGDLIYCHLHSFPNFRGEQITVSNVLAADEVEITIPLDPALSLADNAQRYYKQYQKLKNRLLLIEDQFAQTRQDLTYWQELQSFLELAETGETLLPIREEMIAAGLLKERKLLRKRQPSTQRFTPQPFAVQEEFQFYLGRNNLQNDFLTLRFGRPCDYWFHAKDLPGAHVVVRVPHTRKEDDLPEAIIEQAALLAAYFSKGRDSSQVPVDYTQCRNVHKAAGAKPGHVYFERQRTVYVTPSVAKLNTLFPEQDKGAAVKR